jgi:hypothetical protein
VADVRPVKLGPEPARHLKLDGKHLKTLVKSNDVVLIGFVRSLLDDGGIDNVLLDTNMSVLEGSLGILPQRIVVKEEDFAAARGLMREAGLGHEHANEHD